MEARLHGGGRGEGGEAANGYKCLHGVLMQAWAVLEVDG